MIILDNKEKKAIPSSYVITTFFGAKNLYKFFDDVQLQFLEDLVLYNCKGYKPLSTCENLRLQTYAMSPSSISFLVLCSGKNVTYNGEKDIGPTCFAKSENYSNNFSQFRSLDVL